MSFGNLTLSYSLGARGETKGDKYVHVLESLTSDQREIRMAFITTLNALHKHSSSLQSFAFPLCLSILPFVFPVVQYIIVHFSCLYATAISSLTFF